MKFESMEQMIGSTPLLRARRTEEANGLSARLYFKIEGMNPAGSVKDRVALSMIRAAEEAGMLKPGATIIEPTSGNTGIGLAAVGAARGYRVIIVMPDTMSVERRQLIAAYGAEIVLTDGKGGMKAAIAKANELAAEIPGSVIPSQFDNPANPKAHRLTTAPEIWADTDGAVDAFVAGVGTGGTVTGIGGYLKEKKPTVRVIAVEPETSAVLSGQPAGPHKIQGIGAGFVPKVLDTAVLDEIMTVSDAEAMAAARSLARTEGVLAGISSGAAIAAAIRLAKRPEWADKTIVALLPDTGTRYLSSGIYQGE